MNNHINIESWKMNPALLIVDNKSKQTLQFGQMPELSFDVNENYEEIKSILTHLFQRKEFGFAEFSRTVSSFHFQPEALFQSLCENKVIIQAVDHNSKYSRHHYYYSFNGASAESQKILSNRRVMLIGVGGIGSTCALLLTAAGIGGLILADSDLIEESNLTRTVLFENQDIGKLKVEVAREKLLSRNRTIDIEAIPTGLSQESLSIFEKNAANCDFIILSGDSGVEVHQLVYFLSEKFNIPFINAGYVETYGIVGPTTLGKNKKRELELLSDRKNNNQQLNPQLSAASYGPLNSMVSSIAVNEAIRHFLNLSVVTKSSRLVINSGNYQIQREEWV